MAKAILVLNEMPKRCDDCWLANFQREDCYCYCMALQKPIDYDDPNYEEMDTEGGDWRWDKCPLQYPIIYSRLEKWQEDEYMGGWNDAMFQIGAVTMEEAYPWRKEVCDGKIDRT